MGGKKEYWKGCVGCIDYNTRICCCDFLKSHGRVRPIPADRDGCALKAASWREQAELEKQHAWNPKRAERLLSKGRSVKDVAEKVGASRNAVSAMLNGNPPPKKPEVPVCPGPDVWGNEEIPLRPKRAGSGKAKTAKKRKTKGTAGGKARTWNANAWKRAAEFRALYETGADDREIAGNMGLKEKTVGIYRRGLGLPPHRKAGPRGELTKRRKAL